MELRLRPHPKNSFPLAAVLIRNPSVVAWLKAIQELSLSLNDVDVFPVPDVVPNSIWGCMVIYPPVEKIRPGKHELCQQITKNLFIAEKSVLIPLLTTTELEKRFSGGRYLFHPQVGLAELGEAIDFSKMLSLPAAKQVTSTKPADTVWIPGTIRSFQVAAIPAEEMLRHLEEKVFPKQEKIADKPLTFFERAKLNLYKIFFKKEKNDKETRPMVRMTETGSLLASILKFFSRSSALPHKLQEDYQALEQRNQSQVDKLLELLKNNPEEALKYAVPLDPNGITRGNSPARLDFSKRWFDFSIFSKSSPSRNVTGTINVGDRFYEIQNQYLATAEALIKNQDYEKAAFVYMKLLKNYSKAADVLELGKRYQEAAHIHLKHTGNKRQAALCYEKGNMTLEAIEIYKSLLEHEKVADLYTSIHKPAEAAPYYEKVIEDYKHKNQFVKASLIYKKKMNNKLGGQALLLEGWRTNKDAAGCLNNYFSNIEDVEQLSKELNRIYQNELTDSNREPFLQVIKHEYAKKNELADMIKEMAYEIVARQIPLDPSIASELKFFNPNNKELYKDTLKFKLNKKRI